MSHVETTSPFLPLPDGMVIVSVQEEVSRVVVQLACHLRSACCPQCGHPSERVHGTYRRAVADLPCAGRQVLLRLSVRKFVCATKSCSQKIFTERLDSLVQSYARMTNRLAQTLQTLGFATCGELGERLAPQLGMQVSGPTLLRRMRAHLYTPPESVSILGIDDWGATRSCKYSCKDSTCGGSYLEFCFQCRTLAESSAPGTM
jgi:hypothetical protein